MPRQSLSNVDYVISVHQRQRNNIGKDFTIPSLGSMQSHQTAEPSHIVRRSSLGHLSFVEPQSRGLHATSDILRPASACARSCNLARPLSGIREASESSLAEPASSSSRPSGNDGSVDDASRQLNANSAKISSTMSLPPIGLPERKSSQGLLRRRNSRSLRMARKSMDVPSLLAPPPPGSGQTIPSRGQSTSPVRAAAARHDPISSNMRKIPSRTFVRSVRPTDILEFPRIRHQRVALDMRVLSPIFIGGGTVEGQLHILVDGGAEHGRRKAKPLLSLGRISVDILGVEELSKGKRWIFRSLANELIDERHPPPSSMTASSVPLADAFWELVPSTATLPFRLNLPVNMGPPPYHSKYPRIRYILCTSVLVKVVGEPYQIRESQDIAILSVHDPERVLVNLPNPLTAYDELELSHNGDTKLIKLTAGLHRQTWLSGINIWVDVHVSNTSQKTVKKMEIHLEKVTLFYDYSGASILAEDAIRLRLPDRREKEIVSKRVIKKGVNGWKGVISNSSEVRTIEVEIPRGHVTINTGRFFEVRYFLKVHISSTMSNLLTVQLPVTIIHPNSVDIVPNSVAQVAAAIEDKRGYRSSNQGSPIQYNQGSAFAAPRKQSLFQIDAETLPAAAIDELTLQLDGSPRKMHRSRKSTDQPHQLTVSDTSKRLEVEDSSDRPQLKQRSSVALKGPKLQTSTSGVGFEEFAMGDMSDLKDGDGSAKFRLDAQIQRELFVARKRSKDLGDIGGWRNIALEEVKKTKTGEKEIEWV